MRHIMLISGKDPLATALIQSARAPELPYEYIYNETGWELPETWAWLSAVEARLGKPILRLGDDLDSICDRENCLPLPWRRFCTKYAKIQPLNDYLGKSPATVYFGLRADEPDRVGYVPPVAQKLTTAFPLREAGLSLSDVWALCQRENLMPPLFRWAWMEDRVRRLAGNLIDDLPPWERSALLAWRSRNNCSLCFYKRRYEWIGLAEHYPAIFEHGVHLEKRLCHRDELSWIKGFRLPALLDRADSIKEKRARAIAKYLQTKQQRWLFAEDDHEQPDLLAISSCGLLCGK